MERVVFVEVLGRRGDVVQRVRLAQLPASIGRAYSNDVILTDPHVDPLHARLVEEEGGTLILEDLDSVNGLQADGRGRRERRISVAPPTTVRLGRTRLRVTTGDQPVPPAIRDVEPTGPLAALLASPRAMAAVLAAALVLAAISVWLADFESGSAATLLGTVVGLAAGVTVWAAIWAVAGRVLVHRALFWQHLTLATLFFTGMWLTGLAGSWVAFLVNPDAVQGTESMVVLALFLGMIVLHAGLASAAIVKRRVLFAFALAAGLGVLALVGDQALRDEYDMSTVAIEAPLKPLPAGLVPARAAERFLNEMTSLKDAVDRAGEH